MAEITPEMCVGGRELSEPRLTSDGSRIVYSVLDRQRQPASARLVVHSFGDEPDRDVAVEPAIRPARGLGGGAWCFTADEAAVVYVAVDGNLWLQALDGGVSRQLTAVEEGRSISSPHCSADREARVSVVYTLDQAEVHQLFFDEHASMETRRLDDGTADFFFDPVVDTPAADSHGVRWQAWNVPDMPWDRSRIQYRVGDKIADVLVAGSVQQPRVLPDGRSISVRDDDGWLNVWIDDRAAVAEPFEHASPTWGPGQRSYAWSPDGQRIAFARNDRGFGSLCIAEIDQRDDVDARAAPAEIAIGVHGQLSWGGQRLATLFSEARTPPTIAVYDTIAWECTVVATATSELETEWDETTLVEPEPVEIVTGTGIVHARLYQGDGRGLIVWLHGGPTDQWQVSFISRIAYWREQGWTILVPDHRGSTGHGRIYQQALRGNWGVLDVHDTLAATQHAHNKGWGTPQTTVVMGGSSGGFTALESIAAMPSLFAAAVVLYPVTDLIDLTERSHRFERHYTDTLIGALPHAAEAYRERSPLLHIDRFLTTPMLILHGDADPVVPVEQSHAFAGSIREAGGNIELHVYEGEGHGFRQRTNQLDEYSRIASFLARHVPLAFGQ